MQQEELPSENRFISVSYILGLLTSKIDGMDKKLDDFQSSNRQVVEDHETRLRALEKMVWRMSTLSGIAGGIAVTVLDYVSEIILHFIK